MPGLVGYSTAPGLLASIDCTSQVHLIIGSNSLASARCAKSLEAGAKVILIAPDGEGLPYGLQKRVDDNEIEWIRREFHADDLTCLGREEVNHVVDLVFVTLPVECAQCAYISKICKRLRIPVNVVDAPSLCSFTLLSTHSDGPLQIGVTTSGNGCKLANRIRREIVSTLPEGIGRACHQLGGLRRRLYDNDDSQGGYQDEDDSGEQRSTFNAYVSPDDPESAKTRRIRWLSQICEYWPLAKLCDLTDDAVESLFQDYISTAVDGHVPLTDDAMGIKKSGTIQLVGSGPGHPDLLTTASLKAIQSADLVLADKLVPAPVLDLVPRRARIFIAKKFPGNADNAQQELLEMGLQGLKEGLRVVRLKQGDPYIYGRGAEEYEFFSQHGHRPVVIPGISSALCAPLFCAIPSTHRGVADQVLLCTGTGRKGAAPDPPEYVSTRTVVFLMSLHRLEALVNSLTLEKNYPLDTPCAVIERASCPDQRVVRSTLEFVVHAIAEEGSRPPGLLVVGQACNILCKSEKRWSVEEGFRDF
ncbi:tetrapyrrole methylase [Geopyxis carbonaria]|nr:tetrapyrrole methylase [Geopyxis carbonaria]